VIVTDHPAISVVIVNYHSEEALTRCLRSIDAQPARAEVVIADNGSTEENTARLKARYPAACWLPMGGNAGFGAACNAAARQAQGSKLLFLNPDSEVWPDALERLIAILDSPESGRRILGCRIYNPDGSAQLSCRRFPDWRTPFAARFSLITRLFPRNTWSRNYLMTDFDRATPTRADWVSGAAMGARRETFEELHGFDPAFFLYFEDVDLCRRGRERGIDTWYVPDVRVTHLIGGSSSQAPVRALWLRHQSMWRYYRRYHGRPVAELLAGAAIFARFFVLAAGELLNGWTRIHTTQTEPSGRAD